MVIWTYVYEYIFTELLELSGDLIYIYEDISVELLEYMYTLEYIYTHMSNEDACQEGRVLLQIGHTEMHII